MYIPQRLHAGVKLRAAWAAGLVATAILAAPVVARAQAPSAESDASVRAYWTPERLANAKPMERHPAAVRPDGLPLAAKRIAPLPRSLAAPLAVRTEGSAGGPLASDRDPLLQHLYTPKAAPAPLTPESVHTNSDFNGDYYTTTRVFPQSSEASVYPYRAAGHLFFTIQRSGGLDGPGNYLCTASVIQPRVVLTAGHCLGSPIVSGGSGFFYYSKWLFVPADANGTAPYGSWTPNYALAGKGWVSGNGSVPNSEDWGFLVMNDIAGVKIGSKVGWLGTLTFSLSSNNITQLGYPGNLDGGNYMQQNQAQIVGSGGNNTYLEGSAMGPGSSGGPWIMDFGQSPTCTGSGCPTGNNRMGLNYVVAVTSYGPRNSLGYEGASQFNSDFSAEFKTVCNRAAGNC